MDCIGHRIATEATVEPVSVSDMKLYLRLDDASYDSSLLPALIKGARQYVERVTGRHLAQHVVAARYAEFDSRLRLPTTPVQSIVSISYQVAGVTTTLDDDAVALLYELQSEGVFPALVELYSASLPTCDRNTVIVSYNSGTATPDEVGKTIIKALVADLFEHPEANVEATAHENRTISMALNAYGTGW